MSGKEIKRAQEITSQPLNDFESFAPNAYLTTRRLRKNEKNQNAGSGCSPPRTPVHKFRKE
jgi:hypothetical protein